MALNTRVNMVSKLLNTALYRARRQKINLKAMVKKNLIALVKFVWYVIAVAYAPIYIISWLLHKVARLLLALSYFGLLEKRFGADIIKSLFTYHGQRKEIRRFK